MTIDLTPGAPGGEVHVIVLAWLLSGLFGTVIFVLLTGKYYGDLAFAQQQHLSIMRLSISRQALNASVVRLASALIVCGTGAYTLLTEFYLAEVPSDAAADPIAPWIAIIPWLMVIQGLVEYRHERWLLKQVS